MDERAWDFLIISSSAVQAKVVSDFKPRSEGDSDYSAAITAFVRAVTGRTATTPQRGPTPSQLDAFRMRYAMDDRAFDFLMNCLPAVQQDVLQTFSPRSMQDG